MLQKKNVKDVLPYMYLHNSCTNTRTCTVQQMSCHTIIPLSSALPTAAGATNGRWVTCNDHINWFSYNIVMFS